MEQNTRTGLGKLLQIAAIAVLFVASATQAKDIPGSAETSYGVSANGAFQFSVPIVVPAGTGGVQPNLSLSYSSDRRNGPLGVGWGLSGLSAITRCGSTFATNNIRDGVEHDGDDRYCLNGKQLILASGSYGRINSTYRTEIEEFSIVKVVAENNDNINGDYAPTEWEVKRKGGSVWNYGGSAGNAAFKLPGSQSIHSWKLRQMADLNGNFYQVNYETTEGLPQSIVYTGNTNGSLTTDKAVEFLYTGRQDERTRYVVGKKIEHKKRLASVRVKKGSTLVRQYQLGYETQASSGYSKRSRISSVTECGMNSQCMPPIEIEWRGETEGFAGASSAAVSASAENMIEHHTYQHHLGDGQSYTAVKEITRGQWADVNGDGRLDQVIAYTTPAGTDVIKTLIKTDTGWDDQGTFKLPHTLRDYSDAKTNMVTGFFKSPVINKGQLIDVNADGLVDVVYSYRFDPEVHQYHNPSTLVTFKKTYINNGLTFLDQGTYTAPEFIFDYYDEGDVFGYAGRLTTRGRFADVNGDGLVDWVTAFRYRQAGSVSKKKTYINNGTNNWVKNDQYAPKSYFNEYFGSHQWERGELVDVNGDGLLDWVEAYVTPSLPDWDGAVKNTWINTGSSFQQDNSYNLHEYIFEYTANSDDSNVRRGSFVDVNGDGLRDFVRSFRAWNTANTQRGTLLNTGKGWSGSGHNYTPPFTHIDYLYMGKTGDNGNQQGASWQVMTTGNYIDVNRDGLVDFVQSYKDQDFNKTVRKNTWLNTGETWVQDNNLNTNVLHFDYSGRNYAKPTRGQFVDTNSDASLDWVESRAGVTNSTKHNNLSKVDLVAKAKTTMGYEIKPEYKALTQDGDLYLGILGQVPDPAQDSFYVAAPICVVSDMKTSSADNSFDRKLTYSYSGAQIHRRGRGYLGFRSMSVFDADTYIGQITYYNQEFPFVGRQTASFTHHWDTQNGGSVSKLNESTSEYSALEFTFGGLKTYHPYTETSVQVSGELGGDETSATKFEVLDISAQGDVKHATNKVWNGNNTTDPNGWISKSDTVNVYQLLGSSSNSLQTLLKSTTTTLTRVGTPTITRKNSFTHDTKGRVDLATREPDQSDPIRLVTDYDYDDFGNVTLETVSPSANPRASSIEYLDGKHRFPTRTTNAEGHISNITYDSICDQPASVEDANGATSKFTYDNFCRQIKETSPEGVITTTQYSVANLSCALGTACQVAPKFKLKTHTAGRASVSVYFNHLGQPLLSQTSGMFGEEIIQRTEYDYFGRVEAQSQPYFTLDTAPYWTDYEYDDLGRVTKTLLPYDRIVNNVSERAETTVDYAVSPEGWRQVTAEDTLDNTKISFTNALGQVVRVTDAAGSNINYKYDAQGNLKETLDPYGNKIVVGYDLLGRRSTLNDPDLGTSSYTYSAFGDLLTQTDAKNQTLVMTYDKLGRMKTRLVPGTESAGLSTFTFDTAPNGVGGIASISRPAQGGGQQAYLKTFTYDSYGRPTGDTTTINGETYTRELAYNALGQISYRRLPDSGTGQEFSVYYHYQNGYLSSITDGALGDPNCIEHWRANKYDALGRATEETIGKIIESVRGFESGQGVLETITSTLRAGTLNGTAIQNLDYDYDAANNLLKREDIKNSVFETFEYDELYRLEKHTSPTGVVDVTYDAIGNILTKSDVGTYNYLPSTTSQGNSHRLNSVSSPSGGLPSLSMFDVDWQSDNQDHDQSIPDLHDFTGDAYDGVFDYDANGNIKQSGNRYVWWTAFDKPSRIERYNAYAGTAGVGSSIEYDPEFNRMIKEEDRDDGSFGSPVMGTIYQTTVYIGKEYERIESGESGNTTIKHRYTIAAGSHTVQIERADGSAQDEPKYLLSDNLGSTNVIVNAMGEVEQTLTFDPWGMRTNLAGTVGAVNKITNRGYTGHEMDDETGLVNMNARIYDPYLGRFLSADPVLQAPFNLASFNRYSYVWNNPLKFTDPTGNTGQCALSDGDLPLPSCDVQVVTAPPIIGTGTNGAGLGTGVGTAGGAGLPSGLGSFITIGQDGTIDIDFSSLESGQTENEVPDDASVVSEQLEQNSGRALEEIVVSGERKSKPKSFDISNFKSFIDLGNGAVLLLTGKAVELAESGSFAFEDGRVRKLSYKGNQFDSSDVVKALKNEQAVLAKIGRRVGATANVLTIFGLGTSTLSYASGEIGGKRYAYETVATLTPVGVASLFGIQAGALSGLGIFAVERGYAGFRRGTGSFHRRYVRPPSIEASGFRRFMIEFGLINSGEN